MRGAPIHDGATPGDIVDKNLLGIVSKAAKLGVTFSKSGQAEMLSIADAVVPRPQIAYR